MQKFIEVSPNIFIAEDGSMAIEARFIDKGEGPYTGSQISCLAGEFIADVRPELLIKFFASEIERY